MKTMSRKKLRKTAGRVGIYLAAALLFCWTVAPLLWMFLSSIVDKVSLLDSGPLKMPESVSFWRYQEIFADIPAVFAGEVSTKTQVFVRGMINSLLCTLVATSAALILGGVAAYAFARLTFRGGNFLLMAMLFTQLLPVVSLLIPLYMTLRVFGMINRVSTLMILYTGSVLPYVIWVLSSYYRTIPADLESAARIDGCSYLQAFTKVVLPLAKPGFVAVGCLAFLLSWDEFLYALIFTNSASAKTMPVALSEFSTQYTTDYGMVMTGGCLATIVPLTLAMVFQRHIVMGLTSGGVKD